MQGKLSKKTLAFLHRLSILTVNGELIVMKSSLLRIIFCFSLFAITGCVSDQEFARMDNRLSNLERRGSATDNAREQFQVRMEDFRKSQIEKEQQSRGQYAEIYATIDRIQEEIQSLNGKLEEKQHDSMQRSSSAGGGDSIEARLNNVEQTTASFRDRLARIEEYLSVDGGARKSAIGKTDSEKPPAKDKPESAPSAELSENDLYAKAKQEFDLV